MFSGIVWRRRSEVVARKVGSVQWLRDGDLKQQREFYAAARTLSSAEIQALCRRQVAVKKVTENVYADGGQRLPLSVWKERGWDIEAIQANATSEDIEIDPKWKWTTYRVAIKSDSHSEKIVVEDSLNFLLKARTRALKRTRSDDTQASQRPSAAGSESEADPSQSSSSSSDRRGSKKSKKSCKGKHNSQKPDKRAKTDAKKTSAVKAKAKAASKKIEAQIAALRKTVRHDLILDCAPSILGPVQQAMKSLSETQRLCQKSEDDGADRFSEALAALNFADIKRAEKTLRAMLQSLAKARK